MSTNGDNNSSVNGTPDVVEQYSSSPNSGRSRGGRSSSSQYATRHHHRTDIPSSNHTNSSASTRGRGKSNGRTGSGGGGGRFRGGLKDGNSDHHQPMTLMRTHSAPPDEHAGIFELGGNGVRANTSSQAFLDRPTPQTSDPSHDYTKLSTNTAPTAASASPVVINNTIPSSTNIATAIAGNTTATTTIEIPPAIPRTIANGSQISSIVEEKQFDEKSSHTHDTLQLDRPPPPLAPPIPMPLPHYFNEPPRGYPSQPQISPQQIPPNHSIQQRMIGQPRPNDNVGDRNKNSPQMQLPPRMPPPHQTTVMPQYYSMPPQLQMMPNQPRPIPLPQQLYSQPPLVYHVYPGYPPGFSIAPGVPVNRNPNMMTPGMDHPPRQIMLDPRLASMGHQKMPSPSGLYNYGPPNMSFPVNPEQQLHLQQQQQQQQQQQLQQQQQQYPPQQVPQPQRVSATPSEPLKKRTLTLKDKTGKIIVPKDLLDSHDNGAASTTIDSKDSSLPIVEGASDIISESSDKLNSDSIVAAVAVVEISNSRSTTQQDANQLTPQQHNLMNENPSTEIKDQSNSQENTNPITSKEGEGEVVDSQNHSHVDALEVTTAVDKRTKKNIKKDKIAAAELRDGDILDAYTSPHPDEICELLPPPAMTSTVVASTTHIFENKNDRGEPIQKDAKDSVDDGGASDDDWETQASKLPEDEEVNESIPLPLRSLRPGGGSGGVGVGVGVGVGGTETISSSVVQNSIVIVYTKSEILGLRVGIEKLERPLQCLSYEKLVFFGTDNQQIPRTISNRPQHSQSPKLQGTHPERWKQPNSNYSPNLSSQPNEPPHNHKRHPPSRGSKKSAPPPPMPKKVITDPAEYMMREVMVILNKITPQTFLKLTGKLGEIQIHNSAMLEKLVRLIFDKAVLEPSFANLYAEMCSILDAANNYSNFCHIVLNRDTNQYLWIKDINYSNILAGPYHSVAECIDACLSRIPPPTQLITQPVSIAEEVIINNILISVFKTADVNEFFGTFIPVADIDRSSINETCFSSQDAAAKSLLKKYGFNKILVKICQDEYLDSIENKGYYATPAIRRSQLEGKNLNPDELAAELAEIEELEGQVKRRMMGNIRFIGELCKKSIIKTTTMHECIRELLFSKPIDEQELELVCKLLRTVGEKMEQNLNEDQSRAFDSYFVKLAELSTDTRYNIRIRFAIEDIISLRENNWQERRAADGPALIEEIRLKAANEEQMRKQQANMKSRGRGHPGRGGGGSSANSPATEVRILPSRATQDKNTSNTNHHNTSSSSHNNSNSNSNNQRRPSIPSASPELRPRSNSYDSPASVKTPVDLQERQQLSEDAIKRRVKSIVEEYLNLKDPSEANECLVELPESACGELVNFIIGKYLDSGKLEIQQDLIALLKAVMPQLCAARQYIEESISSCEPLLFIVDSMTDVKQAPELLGTVIAVLLSGQACRKQVIDDTLAQIRNQNLSDEFGISDDEVVAIQNRLLSTLSGG